jgi:hypothetical protein
MWESGLSAGRIAEALGWTKSTVIGRVHRMGLAQRGLPPGLRGERIAQWAATPEDREALAGLWFSGLSAREVARRMGEGWSHNRVSYLVGLWKLPRSPAAMPARRVCNLVSRLATRASRERAPAAPPPPIPRDLVRGGCLWPLWGLKERATHLDCGEPISPGCARPWCERHRAIGSSVREAS